MEKSTPVPTTDDEVIELLTEGRGVPIDGEKSYVNWRNDFQNLADDLFRLWIDEGPAAFVDRVRDVSRQICEEAFERQGDDPSLIEQRHIDATAVRTMFSPDTNVGSRSDYVGGVFAQIQARVVAHNIARIESGKKPDKSFEASGSYILDQGAKASKIDGDFDSENISLTNSGLFRHWEKVLAEKTWFLKNFHS